MLKDKTAIIFIFTTFITGLCGAFFYPLSSIMIVEGLGASPAMLSIYMVLCVFSGVIVAQFIAHHSDKNWSRKTIMQVGFFCYLITVVCFSFIRDYYLAISISVVFGSVSGAIAGQLFALGREYADKHLKSDSGSFLSTMRAAMALAWVFGPPLAFTLKGFYGFSAAFLTAAACTVVAIIVIHFFIPDAISSEETESDSENSTLLPSTKSAWYQRIVVLMFAACLLMAFSANNIYVTAMPLYLSVEMQADASWAGMLFGLAALCEIPIMLGAGWLALKFGTRNMLVIGLASGVLFFWGMLNATELWHMLALQVPNGVFIGVFATLGMVALQDMMKDQLGVASTLFTNLLQISMLVASVSIGFLAEMHSYFSTFYLALLFIVLALVSLLAASLRKESDNALRTAVTES
ncbi:sugar efflux transporter [Vibrio sonorensis]|uniref:sugar efflux transporter n=1 Tax=Vibrio sonorensis TaxID=1004316 RepID=UPI0008D95A18|nr:sugar efflux transporter [Vibrio sonorensis]